MFKRKGFVNIDNWKESNPDVLHDLNKFPYPFEEDTFELIEGDHIIEHLEKPFKVMEELHRILKPKGRLVIRVPHSSRGFTHPEHEHGFDVSFPLYFDPDFSGGYRGFQFFKLDMRLKWFAQPYLKKKELSGLMFFIGNTLGKIINPVANFSPYACSRIWCYWVGGFEEIGFVFEK